MKGMLWQVVWFVCCVVLCHVGAYFLGVPLRFLLANVVIVFAGFVLGARVASTILIGRFDNVILGKKGAEP